MLRSLEDPDAATGAGSSACAATNIHNARRRRHRLPDRPGPRLRRQRRATPPTGNKKFQPQFDVMSDGWRQPGSAIKPIDYVDRHRRPDADRGDDVHGRRDRLRRQASPPTQADKLERGPVRLRSALQFSLNIPAIKAGIINGLDHLFDRTKDFGLTLPAERRSRSMSMGIGTLEVHPIDLLGAYGAIANGGVLMPRTDDPEGHATRTARSSGPLDDDEARRATQVISPQAAYIITDILAGNTDMKVNPFWGKWAIYDGTDAAGRPPTRRARRTTTATSHAYGYLAPPKDPNAPGARRRGLDGQQRQRAERRHALARLVGAALVGDPDRRQQGHRRSPTSSAPAGLVDRHGRRVHRPEARAVHARRRSRSCSSRAPCRPRRDDQPGHARRSTRRAVCSGRTAASGRR